MKEKEFFVYILKCSDNTFYTGMTSDLEKRINEHNNQTHEGYTSKRLPVELVYSQKFFDFDEAMRAEKRIKKWSHLKKQALIDGDFEKIKELSKKR